MSSDLETERKDEYTIFVRSMQVNFAQRQCLLLNFSDITSYKKLEQEQEKTRLLYMLNTMTHHEMLAPLNAQMDISKSLFENSTSYKNKKMAQLLNLSSHMLMLHTQDLLDQRIIEYGSFKPCYTLGSVKNVIIDIVNLVNLTLTKQLKIRYFSNNSAQKLMLDKRRLQQVLLNLLTNAVKH